MEMWKFSAQLITRVLEEAIKIPELHGVNEAVT
jgi:hypothetical protein